jgi:DNA-binding transcriptional MerR regulator
MAKEKYPEKLFYKIGEVCRITDTQPYVLRFWESEFPQLSPQKNKAGQRVYRKRDIQLVFEIKKLLYDEEFTIAGARKKLGMVEPKIREEEMPLFHERGRGRKPKKVREQKGTTQAKLKRLQQQLENILDLLDKNNERIKELESRLKKKQQP